MSACLGNRSVVMFAHTFTVIPCTVYMWCHSHHAVYRLYFFYILSVCNCHFMSVYNWLFISAFIPITADISCHSHPSLYVIPMTSCIWCHYHNIVCIVVIPITVFTSIPSQMVSKVIPTLQFVSTVFSKLWHSLGLNDVSDWNGGNEGRENEYISLAHRHTHTHTHTPPRWYLNNPVIWGLV